MVMLLEDTSSVEVLGETMPPEDTSRSVPLAEDIVFGVTRVGEVDVVARASELERRDSERS